MVAIESEQRAATRDEILSAFGFAPGATISGLAYNGRFVDASGETIVSLDPTTGRALACVQTPSRDEYDAAIKANQAAFDRWRQVPAPRRGEIVRQLGEVFRQRKEDLARLIA